MVSLAVPYSRRRRPAASRRNSARLVAPSTSSATLTTVAHDEQANDGNPTHVERTAAVSRASAEASVISTVNAVVDDSDSNGTPTDDASDVDAGNSIGNNSDSNGSDDAYVVGPANRMGNDSDLFDICVKWPFVSVKKYIV